MKSVAGAVGRSFLAFLLDLSRITLLFRETAAESLTLLRDRKRRKRARVLAFVDEIGSSSLFLVVLVASLIGVVLTVLVSFQLKELGVLHYVPGLVSVAVFREMGPLITAILIAGRVGAAITAKLGTMQVTEEVLALETMAISPVRFLVVERFLGMLIALPALTVLACFSAVAGAFLFGAFRLGIPADTFLREALDVLTLTDVASGVVKASVFAVVIVMIAAHRGLSVRGSAEEVGRSTMLSVVWSTLAIIIMDTMLTTLFYG